jgi:hypothetical protein
MALWFLGIPEGVKSPAKGTSLSRSRSLIPEKIRKGQWMSGGLT